MNKQFDDLMYSAGLTAQGCWDQMDEYNRDAILKVAQLIVRECIDIAYEYDAPKMSGPGMIIAGRIDAHFGVEE